MMIPWLILKLTTESFWRFTCPIWARTFISLWALSLSFCYSSIPFLCLQFRLGDPLWAAVLPACSFVSFGLYFFRELLMNFNIPIDTHELSWLTTFSDGSRYFLLCFWHVVGFTMMILLSLAYFSWMIKIFWNLVYQETIFCHHL